MSEQTKIQWATHTFNPWIGCTKVSPGCAHCYAEMSTPTRVHRKNGRELWGRGNARVRTSASYWKDPLRWNSALNVERSTLNVQRSMEERPRVFPSLCDWLDDEVPIEWLADFLKLIHDTPNLDWLLLTKRPENFVSRLHKVFIGSTPMSPFAHFVREWFDEMQAPPNVWLGVSVEDQKRAEDRIPELLRIPAAVRFLSVEPLLGPVNVAPWLLSEYDKRCHDSQLVVALDTRTDDKVDWVILGGESGPAARPCNVEWIRDLLRQCQAAGVPCFVKQLGSRPELNVQRSKLDHPKGGDPAEWPEDLRVRQFPSRSVHSAILSKERPC